MSGIELTPRSAVTPDQIAAANTIHDHHMAGWAGTDRALTLLEEHSDMPKTLYTLEVTITEGPMAREFLGRNPVLSRTIEIRADQTLNQLHEMIFSAFGRWDDSYLLEFNFGSGVQDEDGDRYVLFIYDDPDEERPTGIVTRTRLGKLDLQPGQVFWYRNDHGGDWQHRITVVAIGEPELGVRYPRVVAGVGESPPQRREWEADGGGGDGEAHEPTPRDWLAEVLDDGRAVLDMESGVVPIEPGTFVAWIRRRVPGDRTAAVREAAASRSYHVTTLRELPDGTGEVTSHIVPGPYLDPWLDALLHEEGVTVVSVE